jgi:hypothetical protein
MSLIASLRATFLAASPSFFRNSRAGFAGIMRIVDWKIVDDIDGATTPRPG